MASLILVLREGAIKQALVTVDGDDAIDQPTLNAVAGLLNERLADMTARRAEVRLAVLDDTDRVQALAKRVGERVVKVVREYDADAIEEVYSDGLLNVMEAPEFAESEKLRRVFTALANRSYLGELVGLISGAGGIHVFIGHENTPAEMREVSLVLAPYGRPGRAVGVVGVLGPTRMAYPHAIGTVGFVSGLMNELVDHLYA